MRVCAEGGERYDEADDDMVITTTTKVLSLINDYYYYYYKHCAIVSKSVASVTGLNWMVNMKQWECPSVIQ